MAGRIRESSIADVREATDIVALVADYVALKPAGGTRMRGLCPFHQEKTPSFTVDSARGLFHCFGCGQGGDAIDFLERQANLDFVESVEQLAARAGIELQYESRAPGERGSLGRKSRLVAAHVAAVAFAHRQLLERPEGRAARDYLRGRSYDGAAAARFQLGWAPADSWDAMCSHLRGLGFSAEELIEAGLARVGPRGLRDAFHARVLFPVFDLTGNPVAFGGRVIDPEQQPKYLNTGETPIFSKGRMLYALNWAKQPIVKAGFAVVVEGYTDVLSLHLAGVEQAVAVNGTALKAEHFRLLARFTNKVVLALDADDAGTRATADKGISELVGNPDAALSAFVLTLPAGQDPADFVATHGGEGFRELVAGAQPLVRWWLDRMLAKEDLRNPEGRSRAANALVPILQRIPDQLQRNEYARSIVQRLHLDERAYLGMVAGAAPAATVTVKDPPRRRSPEARIECEALKFALQHPDWTEEAATRWDATWFTTPATSASFAALQKAGGVGAPLDAILEAAPTEVERRFLRGLSVEGFLAGEEDRRYADVVFRRLEELEVGREVELVKGTLQRMNPVEQPDAYTDTFEQLIALEARRRVLREAAALG